MTETAHLSASLASFHSEIQTGAVQIVDLTHVLDENTPPIRLPPPKVSPPRFSLRELSRYDERGQPLTTSLMDYAVPRADQLPSFDTARTVTPTPVNPLGIKGAGETGTIASTPAIANAVMDALAPFGVTHIDMPLTPDKLWSAMRTADGRT